MNTGPSKKFMELLKDSGSKNKSKFDKKKIKSSKLAKAMKECD